MSTRTPSFDYKKFAAVFSTTESFSSGALGLARSFASLAKSRPSDLRELQQALLVVRGQRLMIELGARVTNSQELACMIMCAFQDHDLVHSAHDFISGNTRSLQILEAMLADELATKPVEEPAKECPEHCCCSKHKSFQA